MTRTPEHTPAHSSIQSSTEISLLFGRFDAFAFWWFSAETSDRQVRCFTRWSRDQTYDKIQLPLMFLTIIIKKGEEKIPVFKWSPPKAKFYGLEKLTAAAHRVSRAIRHPSDQVHNHQGLEKRTKPQLQTTRDSCVSRCFHVGVGAGMGSSVYLGAGIKSG